MITNNVNISQEDLKQLLLQFKYHTAIRRVARGVTHSYNNIFTGLGGQTAMLQQETPLIRELSGKRGDLIDSLLQRGIEQTATLYTFARESENDNRNFSSLLLATRALDLLNSISRVHRFVLKSSTQRAKIFCNIRDIVLVLFYLGENCVDATPEGGEICLEIVMQAVTPENASPSVAFCFRDHGNGFPEALLSSLYAPFVTTRDDTPFRGLGLYAAASLAQKHQGRLTIERNCNETIVCSLFPAILEDTGEVIDTSTQSAQRQSERVLQKQCFLVVEDDEAMRTLLLVRLQRRGHMVFCVNSCAEALEEYKNLYDIITTVLMDVGLRDASGFECQKKILKINPKARIIFMSGQHERTQLETEGTAVFLQKPFSIDQLEKAAQDLNV